MTSGRARRPWTAILAVLLLAGVVPMLCSVAADVFFTEAPRAEVALHQAVELMGACVALGVAGLLLMRAREEPASPYLLWVVAALLAMGLVDAAHAVAPVSPAWSWLRHVSNLLGGLLFALVWLPVPGWFRRRHGLFVGTVAALATAAALLTLAQPQWLPNPWLPADPEGVTAYTPVVKAVNALGGLGFLAAAVFFLDRYRRRPRSGELVFATLTLLFATASLLFGYSKRWAADWWGWHGFRLVAYLGVIGVAWQTVLTLYHELHRRARQLEAENAERRQAEAELARHRDHLEQVVEARTGALREADRRKNEFLAVLSHELRNPLAPIRNSLFILRRVPAGGAQAARAQAVIERQVAQLTRLVDDLLDITRISRNKVTLRRRRLDLGGLVRRVVEDHRSVFDAVGVSLEAELDDGLFVDGDAERLAQAIGNLLQNAAKFTPRGGTVRVSSSAEPGRRRVVVRVADTGVGMEPQLLPRLFEPFMQADTTLDRSKGGLGLGLALVKGLVELHGGEVVAESRGPGRGTTFTVRLPRAEAVEESPAEPLLAAGRRRRVLVIEDNRDAAESLREMLELAEHEVEVVHTGAEGIAAARARRPEVVLCDIGLPQMDGYEVARALRADGSLRGTCLVALTGYALPEDLDRASEAGFHLHLAKPPSPERLYELLATLA